jgi:hypothetical protein
MSARAVDLELWVPADAMDARLAYVARNFFVGLSTIRFRQYAPSAVPGDVGDLPRLVLCGERGRRPRAGAPGVLVAPVPRWTADGRGELATSLREVVRGAWRDEIPLDLVALLFDAYSLRGVPTGDARARSLFSGDGLDTEPWIDLARGRVLGRLGLAGGRPRADAVMALTHDVDNVDPYALGSIPYGFRQGPWTAHGAYRTYDAYVVGNLKHAARVALSTGRREVDLPRWIRGERERGLRSTYYFMEDRAARHDPRNGWYSYGDTVMLDGRRISLGDLMALLAREGFEVGPHVGLHAYATPDAYSASVVGIRARASHVASTRHHWCMVAADVTLGLMEGEGIRYDLNLGGVGFPAGTCLPFHLYRHDESRPSDVVAIPTVLMDDLLFKSANLSLAAEAARARAWDVLRRVEQHRGVAAISFHPSAYRGLDKRGFYFELVDACRTRGIRLTTAAEAGAAASRRFPTLIDEPRDRLATATRGPIRVSA